MKKLLGFMLLLLMLSAVAPQAHSAEAKKDDAFAAFWTQFKAAVAKNDKDAVAALTRFPVEIGENVTKAAFLKKYPEFFTRKVQGCFAKGKPVKDDSAQGRGSYSLFCGEEIFLFEKVDGRYLFTGIGVND
jgi:hypothetical protein